MPFIGLLHIVIAIFFAVHAVRTGRQMYWLFILLAFPLLGSLVYLFAEFLPEQRNSRLVRKTGAAFKAIVDPGRELREAEAALEQTPSMGNRLRLAQALLGAGRAGDALPHFEACAQGFFAKDPEALQGLARAQLAVGRKDEAFATLNRLLEAAPERQTGELALLYAQVTAQAAPLQAEAAFRIALERHSGMATNSAWGQWLAAQGRKDEARAVLELVLKDARLGSAHARGLHREEIAAAQAALRALA
ncbi:MAG: tetratricopeptide repeat protein [Paucibacter sp.]|nr:tetratricopeptide repeat protein [Roseateles sp.]